MGIEKTEALVLRAVDFSETSKVLTLFSKDFGKLRVLAKGGRRLKSSFEVALDLLSVCSICVVRKSSAQLDLLTEAVLGERFDGLRQNLPALYAAYYIAEILDGLTETNDPHVHLYEQTLTALRRLAGGGDRALALNWYQLVLLKELGYAPNLDGCVGCSSSIAATARNWFSVSAGGRVCAACVKHLEDTHRVKAATIEAMRVMLGEDAAALERLKLDSQTRNELWRLTSTNVRWLLGRQPRLMTMLQF